MNIVQFVDEHVKLNNSPQSRGEQKGLVIKDPLEHKSMRRRI